MLVSIGIAVILIVTFQNCARGGDERSMAYVIKNDNPNSAWVVDDNIVDNTQGLASENGKQGVTDGDPLSALDSLSCFQNYISVFEWKNSSANLMSEKPVLSTDKLISLKLKTDQFSDPRILSGWRIEGLIKISNEGQSSSALQFLKAQANSSDSLDCYFMRAKDGATLQSGLANVLFKNIGADSDANIFAGFLRHSEQFIACRISSGHGDIEFKNEGQESTILNSLKAFVLKRGCYPSK